MVKFDRFPAEAVDPGFYQRPARQVTVVDAEAVLPAASITVTPTWIGSLA
jgi:hypothetical protein